MKTAPKNSTTTATILTNSETSLTIPPTKKFVMNLLAGCPKTLLRNSNLNPNVPARGVTKQVQLVGQYIIDKNARLANA